jgi:hypothetical protein
MAKSRESEMREMNPAHDYQETHWVHSSSLLTPPARAGMEQRWVRYMYGNDEDNTNYSRKLAQGWKTRKDSDIPDEMLPMKMEQGRMAGCLVVQGMVLCERPLSIGHRREKHFTDETRRRTDALESDIASANRATANTPFGPIERAVERKLMREVKVQQDDI